MSEKTASLSAAAPAEDDPDRGTAAGARLLLVSGISGAGKTSALKALEDLGYEAVDNVPISLLDSLVQANPRGRADRGVRRPIAIGVDIRTRDFAVQPLLEELDLLAAEGDVTVRTLFLDCDDEELRRRFAETRHRHPLAQDRPVRDGIALERRHLRDLRSRADVVLDTTGMTQGHLKTVLQGHFGLGSEPGLLVFVTSFSFPRGLPRDADLVFDVRFLANPHYDQDLRPLTGRDPAVAEYVAADPGFDAFFRNLTALLDPLLPRYAAEGKSYLTIAVGCTGGRHRSVFVAEKLTAWLTTKGQRTQLLHRDTPQAGG